jgi:hypothetical protein
LTQATGERNASISHPRGRGAAAVKAINGKVELGELRRGHAVSEGADHSKMLLKSRAQRLVGLIVLQTLEVAFARVYNWDVAQRRKERGEAESIEGKKGPSPNG